MSATQVTPEVVTLPDASAGQASRFRNGVLCALLVAVCLWACWPVFEMGLMDDWSYARTVQVYASTGHFAYNGWATAMVGWQIAWGALFVKVFGFSFTILRVAMLPITMASIFLFHEVLRNFGVNPRNAVIGTLTLGLSPLLFPLADSFMTDVPGLLVVLVCLYCCQRAIASSGSRAAILWLLLASATNVAGGTVRQIAWLGALVIVPSAGWMLRRRRGVVPACVILWLASFAVIELCMRWFVHQPYSLPESILAPILYEKMKGLVQIPGDISASLLCSLLTTFPIVVAWAGSIRQLKRSAVPKFGLLLAAFTLLQFVGRRSLPWLSHIYLTEFTQHRTAAKDVPDVTSFLLPHWAAAMAGSAVIAVGLLLAIDLHESVGPSLKVCLRNLQSRPGVMLLGPYAAVYYLLLCPRGAVGGLFDRYLLGILPVFIVWLLLFYQQRRGPALPRSSIVVLCVFALVGIAGTHDWFAWQRARVTAIDEVIASGVPRTQIRGGFEPDGWTQVLHGYINDPRLRIPANAYQKFDGNAGVPEDCQLEFADDTPAIHAELTVGFDRLGCFAPTNYPPVNYTNWLPPFHGTAYVQKIVRQ
ncbi:MAG TPA: hypothetical protein VKT75_14975 [Acidobacteriaceae bacterium]|nr:hypothetical protein [Acidobacteriaceae bacterium]